MQAFPTDHPIKVGNGPICLVLCEWARTQSGETGTNPNPDPKPALRPISDGITTSTMVSVRRSTMTAPEEEGIRTSDIVASILKSVTEVPGPGPKTTTGPFPSSSSSPTFSPTHSPISFPQHHRRPPASQISIFVIGGIVGLALLLGAAWLITRQIRRVKARLNVHTQGVHRDREREVFENEGGKGVPELGRRGVGSLAKGEGERV
ncbi:MAG: hypothetical protein LQ343_004292 [Gyalolechia ehrenbergii]|nr:MAG: hypothetical protein LQ343_004292 [Gyalolechia ehrenbergii]